MSVNGDRVAFGIERIYKRTTDDNSLSAPGDEKTKTCESNVRFILGSETRRYSTSNPLNWNAQVYLRQKIDDQSADPVAAGWRGRLG